MGRREIIADIESKIASGEWPPGFKLPTTKELVAYYDCAVGTIDTVMEILRERGVIAGVAGGRRYVPGAPPEETTGDIGQPESTEDDQPT
jgi:GntR family transcriptional regulator